jgi:hypothetical protein
MSDLHVNRFGNLSLSDDISPQPDPAEVVIPKGALIVAGTGQEDCWGVLGLVEALRNFSPTKELAAFHAEGNAVEGLNWETPFYRWLVAKGVVKDRSKESILLSPHIYVPHELYDRLG